MSERNFIKENKGTLRLELRLFPSNAFTKNEGKKPQNIAYFILPAYYYKSADLSSGRHNAHVHTSTTKILCMRPSIHKTQGKEENLKTSP